MIKKIQDIDKVQFIEFHNRIKIYAVTRYTIFNWQSKLKVIYIGDIYLDNDVYVYKAVDGVSVDSLTSHLINDKLGELY